MLYCIVLFHEPVTKHFVLPNGQVAECLRLADDRQKMFLNEKGACHNDMEKNLKQLYCFA